MQTAANYHIYMEMEGARMIQKEKIRGVGYFLMALAAGLLPFAAPDACAGIPPDEGGLVGTAHVRSFRGRRLPKTA